MFNWRVKYKNNVMFDEILSSLIRWSLLSLNFGRIYHFIQSHQVFAPLDKNVIQKFSSLPSLSLLSLYNIMILYLLMTWRNSEQQMGFKQSHNPSCYVVKCSTNWATGDSVESKGRYFGSRLEPHHAATQPSNDWCTWTH